MSAAVPISWAWRERSPALVPQAALAWGAAAEALHARLAQMPAEQLAKLSLTANLDVLVAIGAPELLPWVAGVSYAAPCPEAPALWLPTCWEPDVPCDLLAQALRRQFGRQPLLLCKEPATALPLDRALPASPALLERIATQHQEA